MTKPLFLIRGIDWTTRSAGINLLHTLAERLHEKGENVAMQPCKRKPGSKAAVFDMKMVDGSPTIVVEPEVVGGDNPWADLTVRWLLNVPGKAGIDVSQSWGKDDLLCHLTPIFAMKNSILLTFGMIDHSIFNNENNPDDKNRTIDCFYGRKALIHGSDVRCPEGALDFSNEDYSQIELAELFRKTKTFYTPELTSCSIEALLCGAKQEFMPTDYLKKDPVDDYLKWHQDFENDSSSSLENFLNVCYDRIGIERKELVYG